MNAVGNPTLSPAGLARIVFVRGNVHRELELSSCEGEIAAVAETLGQRFKAPSRVGLLYRSEPMLVRAWLAAMAAGLEPLILQFPNPKQSRINWRQSVEHTFNLAQLAGAICSPELEQDFPQGLRPMFVGEPTFQDASGDKLPELPDSAAIIQLSSGTTGHRKAIRYSLSQIADHIHQYNQVLQLDGEDRVASWLPLYHDMGFIACFLMPMMLGIPIVMMDPMDWVREPSRLALAIAKHGATTCFMPNFGFEVMSRSAGNQPLPTMRRWISCSEPVVPETMRRFMHATGTAAEQLAACYGMAENVFAVAHRVGFATCQHDGRELASCGPAIPGTDVKIVESEIWIRSAYSLAAYLDGLPVTDSDGFYATGDLGAVVDGELVVAGRKHDVLNVAGKKYFLSDLDRALERVVPGVDGRAASLARREPEMGTDVPLFLIEDRDFYLKKDSYQLRPRLSTEIDIEALQIDFVPPGFISKTSSGKINRNITAAWYDAVLQWRDGQATIPLPPSPLAQLSRLFGNLPQDKAATTLLDSLGLTTLGMLLEDAGLKLRPEMSLGDCHAALAARLSDDKAQAGAPSAGSHVAIVSLADARTISGVTAAHLDVLSKAAGAPVSLEHVCLPPVPVVLSDLVFVDYFLPQDPSEKFEYVLAELSKVRNASVLLIDDVAELLFGRMAYPALNQRFERSAAANLLVWRWQKYTRRHNELPISVVNLWQTERARNDFIARLSKYLGIPIFKIATLESTVETTSDWDFVDRKNADWTMELKVDTDALVASLARFLSQNKAGLRRRSGPIVTQSALRDAVHFCSLFVDEKKLDRVLAAYERFCLIGPASSLTCVHRKIAEQGKSFVSTESLNLRGQGFTDADFDCVLQVGSWGRPDTLRPVFQIFDAGWDASAQPNSLDGEVIKDAQWFHADFRDAPNELVTAKSILAALAPTQSQIAEKPSVDLSATSGGGERTGQSPTARLPQWPLWEFARTQQNEPASVAALRTHYLDLMRGCLTGTVYDDPSLEWKGDGVRPFDASVRAAGRDWPSMAHSMIGTRRMLQLQRAAEFVIDKEIPGDFIETGVWRGGACILLRAVLKAYEILDRKVWVADSFEGLPPPNARDFPADRDDIFHTFPALAISLETVRANFSRYGLLDDQVVFLKGWFRDTLPGAPIDRLAILRLDGDMYESTIQALTALHDKVSPGGFVIVDDFGVVESCRQAVADFRRSRNITDRIFNIDDTGVCWQRGVG